MYGYFPFLLAPIAINQDLLTISGYLTPLDKENIKLLGRLLGLHDTRVTNLFDGSTRSAYLDSILTAWLNQQDDVQKKGWYIMTHSPIINPRACAGGLL